MVLEAVRAFFQTRLSHPEGEHRPDPSWACSSLTSKAARERVAAGRR